MPRLPTLDDLGARPVPVSNRSITSNAQAGAEGEAVARLGNTIGQVGQNFLEKQDRLDAAAAKSDVLKADVQARLELQDDPDYETWGTRYQAKMKAATEAAAAKIQTGSGRKLFTADAELDALRGSAELAKLATARRVNARVGVLDETQNTLQETGQNAPDDATREAVIGTFNEAINAAAARGDITPAEAVSRKRAFGNTYAVQRIETLKTMGDLEGAQTFLDTHRQMIDPNSEIRLNDQLHDARENRENLNIVDDLFTPQEAPAGAMGAAGVQALSAVPLLPSKLPAQSSGGRTVYLSALRGAENNTGNPNAKNPRSSASGNYQFTDDTFVKTFRAAYPGDASSAAAILRRKNEPALQEKLANLLTDQNQASLRAAGHATTNGNLYLAHFAGSGGANKVLAADPTTPVVNVLGAKVVEANPFLRGKSAGWLRDWAGSKMGDAAGASGAAAGPVTYGGPVGPSIKDLNGRIDAKAEAEGWTPERTEKVRSMAMARANRENAIANQEREEQFNRALAKADALGGTFTDVSQLGDDFYKSSAPDQHRLREMAQANLAALAKPTEVAANGDAIRPLHVMAIEKPEQFAKVNLAQYKPFMTAAEFDEISTSQARTKQDLLKPKDDKSWNPRTGITAAISWGDKFGGVKLRDGEETYRVYRFMESRAREWSTQNAGKAPTEGDYQTFFREATQEVKVQRSFAGFDSLLPDTTGRAQTILSAPYRAQIVKQFRSINGRNPTEAEVQQWFDRMGEEFK